MSMIKIYINLLFQFSLISHKKHSEAFKTAFSESFNRSYASFFVQTLISMQESICNTILIIAGSLKEALLADLLQSSFISLSKGNNQINCLFIVGI